MLVMKIAQNLLETETLLENLLKKHTSNGLLRYKVLSYASVYENLSVSMIIEKLGVKKSNFALLAAQLEKEGLLEIKHASLDKRCRTLQLTQKGKDELDNYFENVDASLGNIDLESEDAIEKLNNYLNKRI